MEEKQIIERLKHNERGWLFLSEEDKECIRTANRRGKIENLTFAGEWENNISGFNMSDVGAHEIFRICQDYRPEPEKPQYIDLPIVKIGGCLGAQILLKDENFGILPHSFTHLHCLPSLPGFEDFWTDNNHVYISDVAANVSKGKTVVARFRISPACRDHKREGGKYGD